MNEQPERTGTPPSSAGDARASIEHTPVEGSPLDTDEVYELQDHEFMLEADDATSEVPPALPSTPPPVPVPIKPSMPRWAAASRALLDSWREPLGEDAQRTIEIPLFALQAALARIGVEPAELSAREQLAAVAQQTDAREAYLAEVEHALAAAAGRARGHAFRIAELEVELGAAVRALARVAKSERAAVEASALPKAERTKATRNAAPKRKAAVATKVKTKPKAVKAIAKTKRTVKGKSPNATVKTAKRRAQ